MEAKRKNSAVVGGFMLKSKWIPALFLIILAAACGDKPTSTQPAAPSAAGPVADTPENRKAAAKKYLEAVPPQELLQNITGNMIQRMPEDARKEFQEALNDKNLLEKTYQISETALVKHFTPDEINAMAAFFGSPAGKSARVKFSGYMREMMPQLNTEMKPIFTKLQEKAKQTQPPAGTHPPIGAHPPVKPKVEPPKPGPVPPAKPETPQPKQEKPAQQPK
ncbi:MAG: DUF2059 domain-containing protein [Deltaproteobacteria bacterium]|nr:MAG: DUF2059 domain-containing protein [Deltaproteobacteria bacterium]